MLLTASVFCLNYVLLCMYYILSVMLCNLEYILSGFSWLKNKTDIRFEEQGTEKNNNKKKKTRQKVETVIVRIE